MSIAFVFDNPQGNYAGYTNLSISDSLNPGESYFVNWSASPPELPADYASFAQKFVNISAENPIGLEVSGLAKDAALIVAPPESLKAGDKVKVKG